jgi:hypothetical protein
MVRTLICLGSCRESVVLPVPRAPGLLSEWVSGWMDPQNNGWMAESVSCEKEKP